MAESAPAPAPRRRPTLSPGDAPPGADSPRPRRGRPPGAKNKRPPGGTPAAGLARRIEALVKENAELKAQLKELQGAFRKIENALTGKAGRGPQAAPQPGRRRGRPRKVQGPPA